MIDGAEELNERNINSFDFLFQDHHDNEDSLLCSAAYLLLTGRHDLWLVQNSNSYLLVCRHPNRSKQILVLPPAIGFDPFFAEAICSQIAAQEYPVTMGRIQQRHDPALAPFECFSKEDESILDWRYPCTILDNAQIRERVGRRFENFRRYVRKIESTDVRSVKIDQSNHGLHRPAAKALISAWAESVAMQKRFAVEDLIEPNLFAYDMAQFDLTGFVVDLIFSDGWPVALYTTELARQGDVANGISLSINRDIKGASEYAYAHTATRLFEAGYSYTNINGAETQSLDDFRKKLRPHKKISLGTYRYRPLS